MGRVQNELNISCLRSAVKLLDRLQLTPLDDHQECHSRHGVSRLFVRYSGILLRGLDIFQLEIPVSLPTEPFCFFINNIFFTRRPIVSWMCHRYNT
jgi:hypothetical protein